jgi:tetratricopeptide (TPR) repeat protein
LRNAAAQAFAEGNVHESQEAIDLVLATGNGRVEDWILAGQVLIKQGEYVRAIEVLQSGLQLEPDHVAIHYERAVALFQLGDVSAATSTFERLAKEKGLFTAWKTLSTVIPGCPNSDNARIIRLREEFVKRLELENVTGPHKFPYSSLAEQIDQTNSPISYKGCGHA